MKNTLKLSTILFLIVAVMGLSIAYAAISTTLRLNGTVEVSPAEFDIHFENLKTLSEKKEAISNTSSITNDKKTINYNVTLKAPGDEVIYTADIVNNGTLPASISRIITTNINPTNDIQFNYYYTNNQSLITEGDEILPKEKINITIEVKILSTASSVTEETITSSLTLEYTQSNQNTTTTTTTTTAKTLKVGDEITIGTESFYVFATTSSITDLIPKYEINSQTLKQDNVTPTRTAFSSTNYWVNTQNQLSYEYGSSYPVYVYSSKSNVYTIVNNYAKSLGGTASLISYDNAEYLASAYKDSLWKNIITTTSGMWLSYAGDYQRVYIINSNGNIEHVPYNSNYAIRPLVRIQTSKLDF